MPFMLFSPQKKWNKNSECGIVSVRANTHTQRQADSHTHWDRESYLIHMYKCRHWAHTSLLVIHKKFNKHISICVNVCVCLCVSLVKMGEGHTHSLIKEVRKYLSGLEGERGLVVVNAFALVWIMYQIIWKCLKEYREHKASRKQQMNKTGWTGGWWHDVPFRYLWIEYKNKHKTFTPVTKLVNCCEDVQTYKCMWVCMHIWMNECMYVHNCIAMYIDILVSMQGHFPLFT